MCVGRVMGEHRQRWRAAAGGVQGQHLGFPEMGQAKVWNRRVTCF